MDLFSVVVLNKLDLNDTGEEGIQFVQNRVDLFVRVPLNCKHNLLEVLKEALSGTEIVQFGLREGVSLQVC